MHLKFIEAGQNPNGGGNWGKFAIGRWTAKEMVEPTAFPGCEGQRITALRGNPFDKIWILDVQAEEGAMFTTNNPIPVDVPSQLREKQIYVCPLFEPFMQWLWAFIRDNRDTWWDELPRYVVLPDAPFDLYGYRRGGKHSADEGEVNIGSHIRRIDPEIHSPGKVVEKLADEAEVGYPPEKLIPRERRLTYRSLDDEQV